MRVLHAETSTTWLKVTVALQSLIIAILGLALYNDYLYNVYLRIYVASLVQRNLVLVETIVGVGLGVVLGVALTTLRRRNGNWLQFKLEQMSIVIESTVTHLKAPANKDEISGEMNSLSESEDLASDVPGQPLLGTELC